MEDYDNLTNGLEYYIEELENDKLNYERIIAKLEDTPGEGKGLHNQCIGALAVVNKVIDNLKGFI